MIGEAIEKALRKIGIPCVWNGGTNIFSTQEAASLISLFDALANPGSQPFAIVLLADALFGLTAEQLEIIRQNGLPEFQLFLSSLATLWQQTSFLTMFNTLMQTSLKEIFPTWLQENTSLDVTQRLVVHIAARPDGRRSVAIYRQLGDILHQISLERSLGLSGLKEFLSRNITKAKPKKSYNSNQSNDELNSSDAADRQEEDPDKYAAADTVLTGTVLEIYTDRVVFTRYDKNGPHVLGHAGEGDPYKGIRDKDLISETSYGKETTSPQEVKLTPQI